MSRPDWARVKEALADAHAWATVAGFERAMGDLEAAQRLVSGPGGS